MKKIIITGVTGQDGSHMVDYLINNTEHTIIGGVRRLSVKNHENIEHLLDNPRFFLIDLDVTDAENIDRVISEHKPDYFINFAANSFVGTSWQMPVNHMQTNCMAVLHQLEAIRKHVPDCRYYNAGSSEEFGDVITEPQSEEHPLRPRSPYGASKCAARHLVKVYRDSYNLYAVQGWLFNHEGTRRGVEFVTRKITQNVARIADEFARKENFEPLRLGNVDSKRDWSDAEDFVDGVWKMLNQEENLTYIRRKKPDDYVIATGKTHTIKDFITKCLDKLEISYFNEGDEFRDNHGNYLIKTNPKFVRPAEVDLLIGDPMKAKEKLLWKPKHNLDSLIEDMIQADLKRYGK